MDSGATSGAAPHHSTPDRADAAANAIKTGNVISLPVGGGHSGTTIAVAEKLGRNAVGVDIRQSQIALTRRRLAQRDLLAQT
jgi:cyclopropane fatty-acyl-phospholipid synthase-like methyltransferase